MEHWMTMQTSHPSSRRRNEMEVVPGFTDEWPHFPDRRERVDGEFQ